MVIYLFPDSKSYLNSVRENDFAKPWREALQNPSKRDPKPQKRMEHHSESEGRKSSAGITNVVTKTLLFFFIRIK